MNKYKFILCLILVFVCGCANIHDKQMDISNGINDQVIDNQGAKGDSLNKEEIQQTLDENVVINNPTKVESKNNNETVNNTSAKNEELSQNKPSFSNGKDNSPNKENQNNDTSTKDDKTETADNEKEQSSNNHESKQEPDYVEATKTEANQEEKTKCTQHNWDDSYGNKPQFEELIFDDWVECDLVMNDIYNNFITEEKPEYEKYYKNSKGQWISSIAAMDVWCDCGAHKYAIFITYE